MTPRCLYLKTPFHLQNPADPVDLSSAFYSLSPSTFPPLPQMIRYGIAYYQPRQPASCHRTQVRLVPNLGLRTRLHRTAPGITGFPRLRTGYYDIWDDSPVPSRRSGKTAVLGPLDAAGLADNANFGANCTINRYLNNMPKVHGCDIYIQPQEPDIPADHVWIDTGTIDFIEE